MHNILEVTPLFDSRLLQSAVDSCFVEACEIYVRGISSRIIK